MGLIDRQIERYSRQIIVAGGVAQERLLASHLALLGEAHDAESAIYYLAGAGVGHIDLVLSGDAVVIDHIATHARRLNSDIRIVSRDAIETAPDLMLLFVRRSEQTESIALLAAAASGCPVIAVRIESPARIALMVDWQQCLACLVENLLVLPATGSENQSFVASFASVEALKMLMSDKSSQRSSWIEFDSYFARVDSSSLHGRSESPCRHQRSSTV